MKTAALMAAVLFGSLIGGSAIGAEVQAADVPAVIRAGFDRYAVEGAYAAAHTWISGGPLFDDPEALLGTVNLLKSIEKRYGAYLGFRVLQIEKISDATRVIRTEIRYERGPLFATFLCYRTPQEQWIVSGKIDFHTDPAKILSPQP